MEWILLSILAASLVVHAKTRYERKREQQCRERLQIHRRLAQNMFPGLKPSDALSALASQYYKSMVRRKNSGYDFDTLEEDYLMCTSEVQRLAQDEIELESGMRPVEGRHA